MSPVLSAWPSSSMRHLFEVADASAKESAASISDDATAAEIAPSFFILTPLVNTGASVDGQARHGSRNRPPHLSDASRLYASTHADRRVSGSPGRQPPRLPDVRRIRRSGVEQQRALTRARIGNEMFP